MGKIIFILSYRCSIVVKCAALNDRTLSVYVQSDSSTLY